MVCLSRPSPNRIVIKTLIDTGETISKLTSYRKLFPIIYHMPGPVSIYVLRQKAHKLCGEIYWRILASTASVNQVSYDQFVGWFFLMPGFQNNHKLVINTGSVKMPFNKLHSRDLLLVSLESSCHFWQF